MLQTLWMSLVAASSWLAIPALAVAVLVCAAIVAVRIYRALQRDLVSARIDVQDGRYHLERVERHSSALQVLADSDPLTQLPNRRQLFVLLDEALARAADTESFVGVFFVDIDNFKAINDSVDHRHGDRVLMAVAQRLQEAAQGFGFAARLGGDEFTVVYADAANPDPIRTAGLEMVQAFRRPLMVDGVEMRVSLSIGLAIYPEHHRSAEGLLQAADAALARAKNQGRDRLSLCTPELLRAASERQATGRALQNALARDEFELLFQPELAIDEMRVERVEALLRWRLRDGRVALPGEFLPAAEECGLMPALGDWVLCHAVRAAARWYHGAWPDVRVSINVAPLQLIEGNLAGRLQHLLEKHRLPARCIDIELTESVLRVGPTALATLRILRGLGVGIVLDDFGSGRSALSALEELPLTGVKLDRALIAGIDDGGRAGVVAGALIDMCRGLGLRATAEGVERRSQFAWLQEQHEVSVQGHLLCAPISAEGVLGARQTVAALGEALLLENQYGWSDSPGAAALLGRERRPAEARRGQAAHAAG